jgi:hypothetical protein
MKLFKTYEGTVKAMQNTPIKVTVFTDGKGIKVFQKAFYRNNLNRPNWVRNIILEKINNVNSIEDKLHSAGFKRKAW